MSYSEFHSVDIERINKLTIEDIVTGNGLKASGISYSNPVPTKAVGLPESTKYNGSAYLGSRHGSVDARYCVAKTSKYEQYRGRLGC